MRDLYSLVYRFFLILFLIFCHTHTRAQEKLLSRGKDHDGEETKYYLQTATVRRSDSYITATVRKFEPATKRSLLLECKVNCAQKLYIVSRTSVGKNVYIARDTAWSAIVTGSKLESVFKELCEY